MTQVTWEGIVCVCVCVCVKIIGFLWELTRTFLEALAQVSPLQQLTPLVCVCSHPPTSHSKQLGPKQLWYNRSSYLLCV